MSALQFQVAVPNNFANAGQQDTPVNTDTADKKNNGDQFSSLLSMVGNVNSPAGNNPKKDDAKDSFSNDVNEPASTREAPRNNFKKNDGDDKGRVDNDVAKKTEKPEAEKPDNKTAKADNDQRLTSRNKTKEDSDTDQPVKVTGKTAAKNDVENAVDEKEGEEKKSDPVNQLASLMDIIAQLFSAANLSAKSEIQVQTDNAEAITPMANLKPGTDINDFFAVFDDLKNNLAQLKEFFSQVNAQGAPLNDEQTAQLTAINNALQGNLDAFKELMPEGAVSKEGPSLFDQIASAKPTQDAEPEKNVTVNDSDLKSLLNDDIKLVREALQKFHSERSNAKISTANAPIQQVIENPVNNTSITTRDNGREQPQMLAVAAVAMTSEKTADPQLQNTSNNTMFTASASVQGNVSSGHADTNTGGNSGQGGNNQQPQISLGGINTQAAKTASGATQASFSNLMNRADNTPAVEQVMFHVKTMAGSGHSKISIQLHPEDLGKVDITLDVDAKGKTGVTITAENKQTLDLLQRDSQSLQKALAEAGLKTDSGSLSFNLRGGEREGQGQQYQPNNSGHYQKAQTEELQPEAVNLATVSAVTRSYTLKLPDGLDIKI